MRIAVATAVLALAGCGASDEEDVARVLEPYPHSLADGDWRIIHHLGAHQGMKRRLG